MALPILAAIARMGITKAIKKFGKKAVEKARDAEKKTSGAVGKTPSGAKNRAKNDPRGNKPTASAIRSGRKRIGAGVATAATAVGVPKVGGALSDSIASDYKKPPTPAKKSTGNFTAQPKAVEGKGTDLGKMRRDSAKMDANQKVTASGNEQKTASAKSATSVTRPPKQVKAPQDVPKKKTWKDYKSLREARAAGEDYYSKNGRKMAAVLASDLGEGQSLTDYMNSKKRGKVQKPAKKMMSGGMTKKYRDGGSVRGVGKATKGIRACKMR